MARLAGHLRARTGGRSDAMIDAVIVAEAVLGGSDVVLTSDPDDLSALAVGYPRVFVYGPGALS